MRYSSQLEWRLAAQWAGYRWYGEFDRLSADEQSDVIATYRAHHQIAAVLDYEQAKEMKRKNARKK